MSTEAFKVLTFNPTEAQAAELRCANGEAFAVPVWDGAPAGEERVPLVARVSIMDLGLHAGERFGLPPAKAIALMRRGGIVDVYAPALEVLPADSALRVKTEPASAPVSSSTDAPVDDDEDPAALAAAAAAGAPVGRRGGRK